MTLKLSVGGVKPGISPIRLATRMNTKRLPKSGTYFGPSWPMMLSAKLVIISVTTSAMLRALNPLSGTIGSETAAYCDRTRSAKRARPIMTRRAVAVWARQASENRQRRDPAETVLHMHSAPVGVGRRNGQGGVEDDGQRQGGDADRERQPVDELRRQEQRTGAEPNHDNDLANAIGTKSAGDGRCSNMAAPRRRMSTKSSQAAPPASAIPIGRDSPSSAGQRPLPRSLPTRSESRCDQGDTS